MTRPKNAANALSAFLPTHRRTLHAVVVFSVLFCLLDHLVEALVGWDRNFLHAGKDTETLLFFVCFLLGLAFTLATLIPAFVVSTRAQIGLVAALRPGIALAAVAIEIAPDTSPPLRLRI